MSIPLCVSEVKTAVPPGRNVPVRCFEFQSVTICHELTSFQIKSLLQLYPVGSGIQVHLTHIAATLFSTNDAYRSGRSL